MRCDALFGMFLIVWYCYYLNCLLQVVYRFGVHNKLDAGIEWDSALAAGERQRKPAKTQHKIASWVGWIGPFWDFVLGTVQISFSPPDCPLSDLPEQ